MGCNAGTAILCGNIWEYMGIYIYGNIWEYMGIYGNIWEYMGIELGIDRYSMI